MKQTIISIVFILILSLGFSNPTFADGAKETPPKTEEKTAAIEADSAVADASEPYDNDPDEMVDNLINEFLNSDFGRAVRQKVESQGGWIGWGSAEVGVGPENSDWAKHRVMAYEKALIDVENQFIKTQHQQIKAQKIKHFFKNANSQVPDFKPEDIGEPNKVLEILDKLLAVADAKLDQMLDEAGVDKEKFKRVPKAQKHTLLSEALSKSTIVESIGSLVGLIPIQTFEGFNSHKEHVVGVICIVTPKMKQFSYDILHNKGNIKASPNKGKDLYALFSKDNSLLIDQFGIRKMRDKDGYPVLVSFGQWSNSKVCSDKRLKRRYRKAAKKQAEASAKNQIALFLAGKSTYQSNSDISEQFQENYKVHHDNYKEQQMVNSIMDGIREQSKSKANVSISGLTQIYSWTTKHPQYGHEIVGVIVKYSPKDEKKARNLKDWKPNRKTGKKTFSSSKKKLKSSSGSKSGQKYMKLDDF